MKTVEERVKYLPLLVGQLVKTPSEGGGMWFSFKEDDAKTDHELKEIESIGIFKGIQELHEKISPKGAPSRYRKLIKAVVDFSYRSLNNGYETFEPEEIIPILRPLTTITREECLDLARSEGYDEGIINSRPEAIIANIKSIFNWKTKDLMLSPSMTLWLAERGFDVTGAIERGLVLDKTKTKLPITTKQAAE